MARWSEEKSERFQALRRAEAERALTGTERAELDALLADLDADEAEALGPAMERLEARTSAMAAEKTTLERKARELAHIEAEQQRLLTDARSYLERLRQRSAALAEDYLRITGRELVPAH